MYETALPIQAQVQSENALKITPPATTTLHALAWWRSMYCQESKVHFENEGKKWTLIWLPSQTAVTQEWIECVTTHADVGIALAEDGLFQDIDLNGLAPSIRLNAWVLTHANLLDALARTMGLAFTPRALSTAFPKTWSNRTLLSFGLVPPEEGAVLYGTVFIDESLSPPVNRPLRAVQRNESLGFIPFFFQRELGHRTITISEYQRLVLGGGVILNSYEPFESIEIWHGHDLQIRLKPLEDQSYRLLSIISHKQPSRFGANPVNPLPIETPSELLDLEALPVSLTFVTSELSLTLNQLRSLQPGSPIELPAKTDPYLVRILANGVPIGRGQLLRVGDSLVVQVTQMAGNAHV